MPESYRDEQRRLLDELAVSGGDTMLGLERDLGLGRRRRRRRRRPDFDFDPGDLLPFGPEEDSTSTAGFPWLQWLSDRVDAPTDAPTDTQIAVGPDNRLSQLIPDEVRDRIAASGGDRTPDVRPYVPRPNDPRSWRDPILDPFYSNEPGRFQRQVAMSHLRGARYPNKAMAVKGLASLLGLGMGIPGIGALGFLKPSYTDPSATEIGRLTDMIREEPDLRTNTQQLMERAQGLRPLNPPPIWEVEQLQNAQREQQAAAEQATIMAQIGAQAPTMQDQFALLSGGQGMAVDPGQAAPSFDLEAAFAIAGITPEALGL